MVVPEPGFPGNTTREQDAAKTNLEEKVAELLKTPDGKMFLEKFGGNDVAMFRMLRARKFDVDLAATLVKV